MLRKKIQRDGLVILKNILTEEELNKCKSEIFNYVNENHIKNENGMGIVIPDFIRYGHFTNTALLKDNKKIQDALVDVFGGDNYRFCGHNDIGINRVMSWHKDKLYKPYDEYEKVNIFSTYNGEKHEIIKVLIYLQDHTQNDTALKLVPGSHTSPSMNTDDWIQLHPQYGDVIITDQKITHRGMAKPIKDLRVLVSFGFGKNNIFTDQFENGMEKKQNDQNKELYNLSL